MTDIMFSSDEYDANKLSDMLAFDFKDSVNPLDLTSTDFDGDVNMFLDTSVVKSEPQPGSPSAGGFSDSSSSESPYTSSPEASPPHASFAPLSPLCMNENMMHFGMDFSQNKFISPQQTMLPFTVPESMQTFAIGTEPIKKPIQPARSARKRTRETMKSTNTKQEDEDQQTKRQRRLIKNRESAAKSRQRKKEYVDDLERKVETLTEQNHRLETENKLLKEDVGYLSNIIRKTPGISADVLKGLARRTSHSTNSTKAAGVCLLIVLFTFGLFFNVGSSKGFGGRSLPFEVKAREIVPEVLPLHYNGGTTTREFTNTVGGSSISSQVFKSSYKDVMSSPGGTEGGVDSSKRKSAPRELFGSPEFQERTAWSRSNAGGHSSPSGGATAPPQARVFTAG